MRPKSCHASRGSPEGFTLLELLAVLTIMGVLLAIVPAATAGLASLRLREATAGLAETLRQARDTAIRTGRMAQVIIDAPHRSYRLDGWPAQLLPDAVDTISARQENGTGSAANFDRFRFFADGTATGGMIVLRHHLQSRWIRVEWLTGRVLTDG